MRGPDIHERQRGGDERLFAGLRRRLGRRFWSYFARLLCWPLA